MDSSNATSGLNNSRPWTIRRLLPVALPFAMVAVLTCGLVLFAGVLLDAFYEVVATANRHVDLNRRAGDHIERCIQQGQPDCDQVLEVLKPRLALLQARRELAKPNPNLPQVRALLAESGVTEAQLRRRRLLAKASKWLRVYDPVANWGTEPIDVKQSLGMTARAKAEHEKANPDPAVLASLSRDLAAWRLQTESQTQAFLVQAARASAELRRALLLAVGGAAFAMFAIAAIISFRYLKSLEKTERELRESEVRYRELNKQLETRVQERTAQLEAVNKELEAFSYSVSHDLRAPVRTLDGLSQALITKSGGLDEKGTYYLKLIREAAQRMRELIDGMLQLSRMTRARLEIKPVNLSELAQEVVSDLRTAEPDRRATVCIQPDLLVTGDPRLLRAAMDNLIGNAWKYTSKRDEAAIEFGQLNDGADPVFFVRDNGAGFDMEHANKLFTPFQRLHAESEFEGTGIGLATVQRIMARHQGRIWAESAPGQGTTFYFELGTNGQTTTEQAAANTAGRG